VGSIPDGVIGLMLQATLMALGSTQPLTEMTTRDACGRVKAAGA
jgi:hypothetical protein